MKERNRGIDSKLTKSKEEDYYKSEAREEG